MAKGNKVKSSNAKQTEKRDEPAGENVTPPAANSDNANPENQNADSEGSDVMDALGFNAVAAQLELTAKQPEPEPSAEPAQPPEPVGPTLRGPCPTPGCKGRLGSSTVQRVKGSQARVRYLVCHTCGQPGGKETC